MRLYTLRNAQGLEARITNYGGILVSLMVPDRDGKFSDIVLGFDQPVEYLEAHPCFGATIGRYANRIAAGLFHLEGRAYQLTRNSEGNHIHGGQKGFDKVLWTATERESVNGPALDLQYREPGRRRRLPWGVDRSGDLYPDACQRVKNRVSAPSRIKRRSSISRIIRTSTFATPVRAISWGTNCRSMPTISCPSINSRSLPVKSEP